MLPVLELALFPLLWGVTGIWITIVFADVAPILVAIGCYTVYVRSTTMRKRTGRRSAA
jgi:Na+-driven multidrug efflux pump